jgi:hypothetical protein
MRNDNSGLLVTLLGLVGVVFISCLGLVFFGLFFRVIWFMLELGWGLL